MKRCIVCEDKIKENCEELCETCKAFLEWKHKNGSKKGLKRFKEFQEYLKEWRSQNCKEVEE